VIELIGLDTDMDGAGLRRSRLPEDVRLGAELEKFEAKPERRLEKRPVDDGVVAVDHASYVWVLKPPVIDDVGRQQPRPELQ
jgi:hypothetical protein